MSTKRHPDILYDADAHSPLAPLTVRTNVSPDNPNLVTQGPFYGVSGDVSRAPLRDYCKHGYESQREFRAAVCELIRRWKWREGECIEKRMFHGIDGVSVDNSLTLLRLRFHDTPGCRPDEAWIPLYLADPVPTPSYAQPRKLTRNEQLLEELQNFILWGK